MTRYALEDFLQAKTAAAGSFSPDGERLLVRSNLTGTLQLYVVPTAGGEMRALTDEAEPVTGVFMPTTDDIVAAIDAGGNERMQLYMLPAGGGELRPIVHDPGYVHTFGGTSRDGKLLSYATNRRNGVDFDAIVHDLATGEERTVFAPGGWCRVAGFSPDGRYLSVARPTDRPGDNELHLVDLVSGEAWEVSPHDDESGVGHPRWMPDGSSFYFATEQGHEFSYIARYDMASRQARPALQQDRDLSCALDWPGRTLLVVADVDGYTEVGLHDPVTLERRETLPLPGRGIASSTFSRDGRRIAFTFSSPRDAGDAWIYEIGGTSATRLTTSPNPVPRDVLAEPTIERYRSFDGETVACVVYRPRAQSGPAPVIVYVHGGPESRTVPSFNPLLQYFVHRGYAVVAPNVRGSTGYGKRFQHLDDARKRLDSVRDLEALHAWIAADPGLDERRAALMGGSYGGYMTLAGLAFQPDLWAAGVDIVGISSLVTMLENTSAYRRRAREREYGFLDRDRDFLVDASPLTHVDRMRAPLLIIHGTNDPRVPLGEAEQIHAALRARGVPTELLVYPDEGHGLGKLKNRLDAYPKAADFLDRVLGVK